MRAVARVRRCDDRAVEDGADTTQALARAKPLAKKLGASFGRWDRLPGRDWSIAPEKVCRLSSLYYY